VRLTATKGDLGLDKAIGEVDKGADEGEGVVERKNVEGGLEGVVGGVVSGEDGVAGVEHVDEIEEVVDCLGIPQGAVDVVVVGFVIVADKDCGRGDCKDPVLESYTVSQYKFTVENNPRLGLVQTRVPLLSQAQGVSS
jgi:hypothetical protein